MKIIPNTPVNNIYKLNLTTKEYANCSTSQSKIEASALDCLANYNVSFARRAVYIVNYDGSLQKMDTLTEAEKQCGRVAGCVLSGQVSASKDKTFAYADELESPDGSVNIKALKQVMNNFQLAKNQPVYSIDFNGEIKRFNNIGEAATELGITPTGIYQVLEETKPKKVISGYTFVRAFDIEKRDSKFKLIYDDSGKPIVDKKTIVMDHVIDTLGTHIVVANVHKRVSIKLTVVVC